MKNDIPETLEEAVSILINKNLFDISRLKKEDMSKYHFSVGMNIRNAWGLWDKESALHKHFADRFGLWHADDMSGLIFHCFHKAINSEPWEAEKKVEYYHEYWKGITVTGENDESLQSKILRRL